MSEAAAAPADPGATIRSKNYRVLLVFAAVIGVLVSFASWCFLELVHWIQQLDPARGIQDPAPRAGTALAFLLLFKGAAWSISLGSFRGGPTFPAVFLGAAAGLLAAHLPGFSETPAVAVLMAATAVSVLQLPLFSNRHRPAADLQKRASPPPR